MKISNISQCRECGSKSLSWFTTNTILTSVQQGRLNTADVACQFVLGCDQCSETLAVVDAQVLAAVMNAARQADAGASFATQEG